MWAAAIVALMVGGPLGACLFLAAGITHVLKVNKVDAEYAKRGEMPPTARLVEGWLNRQKAAGKAPASATVKPYGSRAYAKQRWAAFWEDLGEKHREQRAAHKAAVAEAKKNGTPLPTKPSWKERLAGWKWSIPNLIAPVGEQKKTPEPKDEPTVEPGTPAADGPRIACDECGVTLADADGGYQHPPGSCPKATSKTSKPPAEHARQAAEGLTESRQPVPGHGPHQGYTVVAVPPAIETDTKENTMPDPVEQNRAMWRQSQATANQHLTSPAVNGSAGNIQQSGEVVGLQSAINYADTVAAAHAQHSTGGGEQYRASLGQANVGPETIASAARAQELSEMAGAAWKAHADKLREQLAAKEHTTAETGTKEFLLND